MAITLIVEDGSQVPNANTYVDLDTVKAYCADRDVTLGDDDNTASKLIKACDYLESFNNRYTGHPASYTQSLCWPREDAFIDGHEFPGYLIPKQLKAAQMQAVISQVNGIVLMPDIQASDYVTEETVGPITTKYANPIEVGIRPELSAVDALLQSLFGNNGQLWKTVRV